MRNYAYSQGVEPNPNLNREPAKTAFFSELKPNLNRLNLRLLNLNWTRTFNISNLWTWTEPEPLKFYASEPKPNPNL